MTRLTRVPNRKRTRTFTFQLGGDNGAVQNHVLAILEGGLIITNHTIDVTSALQQEPLQAGTSQVSIHIPATGTTILSQRDYNSAPFDTSAPARVAGLYKTPGGINQTVSVFLTIHNRAISSGVLNYHIEYYNAV